VAKNVAFGLRRTPRAERDRIVDDLLGTVGLAGYRDRYPHEISGGEGQRVALARALAPSPRLLLLDEPFANLDVNLRAQVRADVVRILRERSTPAVFVTHDQHEAMAIGDRMAVLRGGHLEQIDRPEVVFDRPANRFVAGFVAEAAFLPATRVGDGHTCELGALGRPGGEGELAVVRSTDVTFEPDPQGAATVVSVEFLGTGRAYTVELASGTVVRSVQPRGVDVGPGTRVRPGLRPDHRITLVPAD
jgi:iron(III) transport system ATP-binding protein